MLQPARRKYRKEQKGRNTGVATSGATVAFGDFGLKSTDRGRLTARQIEAARRAISRHASRDGKSHDVRLRSDGPLNGHGRWTSNRNHQTQPCLSLIHI